MGDRNTSQNSFKPRQNYAQESYSSEEVHSLDWKLFMLLASLEKVENYVYLFIVIWDAISVQNDVELSRAFEEETNNMIQIIEELEISGKNDTNYSKILDDYRKNFYNNVIRQNSVHDAWVELEGCGLKNYSYAISDQLRCCTLDQRKDLRRMIFSRMRSFQLFAKQIKEKQEIKVKNKSLLKENESLKMQIDNLKKENSKQQAALGNLTNVSWNDDDPNNTKRLISDIEELQDMLSDFTMVQGNDYKVNCESAASLLENYECQTKYPDTKANLVLGAVLQHRAINIILEDAQKYLQNPYSSGITDPKLMLESRIVNMTESLIKYTGLFRDNRNGEDDITRIVPIKVRQHAYSALGCRGFSNEHSLIKGIVDKLLNEMNKYRHVLDQETNDELYEQAIQITRKVIAIFCFRLKTQALEPTFQFVQAGQDVDARLMQGAFGGREEVKNLEVEICRFPCIGFFDESNQKVFTKAQVIARPKKK